MENCFSRFQPSSSWPYLPWFCPWEWTPVPDRLALADRWDHVHYYKVSCLNPRGGTIDACETVARLIMMAGTHIQMFLIPWLLLNAFCHYVLVMELLVALGIHLSWRQIVWRTLLHSIPENWISAHVFSSVRMHVKSLYLLFYEIDTILQNKTCNKVQRSITLISMPRMNSLRVIVDEIEYIIFNNIFIITEIWTNFRFSSFNPYSDL